MIDPVVDVDWWHEHRRAVVTADVRWYLDGRSGRDAYDAGHLPGAVFVDLDRWLAGTSSPSAGRHPLPDPATFAAGMASCGIGDTTTVVAYDDAGGVIAARLVWMLRVTGHGAALLDGGVSAYDGPLERDATPPPAGTFTPVAWPPERLADIEAVTDRGATVLDARDSDRYRGDHEPVDPRGGHVPGAIGLPCREHVDADGRLLPVPALRARFTAAGATPDADANVIAYCGSGVTACHHLVALEHAGLPAGRLYAGSWSQYSHDSARPAATGEHPG